MWKILKIRETEIGAVAEALKQEYEPFAISTDMMGFCTIWLKKDDMIVEGSYQEIKEESSEVSSKPKSGKGRSRKTAPKSKG